MKTVLAFTFIIFISLTSSYGQDRKTEESENGTIKLRIKDDKQPKIFVDGKLFEFPIELIDENSIATMNVIKGQDAIDKYNSPNGVILIVTKKNLSKEKVEGHKKVFKIRSSEDNQKDTNPVIVIDGKVVENYDIYGINPDDIKSVRVLKDKESLKKYNTKHGVIIIERKK